MSVKDFLNRIKTIDLLIDTKLKEVDALRNMLTNVSVSYDGERVQTSKQGDKFADTIAKIVDLENEINADIDKLVEHKRLAKVLIEKIDDDVLKVILYKRYFSGNTFIQIADEIGYTERWTCELHERALEKLCKEFIEIHIA